MKANSKTSRLESNEFLYRGLNKLWAGWYITAKYIKMENLLSLL